MIQYNLEPEIYSLSLLEKFSEVLAMLRSGDDTKYKIHIELGNRYRHVLVSTKKKFRRD